MMRHDPRNRQHIGDEKFRVYTQQNKARRRHPASPSASVQSTDSGIGEDDCSTSSSQSTRLCGFLDSLINHRDSMKRFPGHNGRVCVACGKETVKCCSICDKALHLTPLDNTDTNTSCFVHCHNTGFFGLARED